jgi:hypothetical protein
MENEVQGCAANTIMALNGFYTLGMKAEILRLLPRAPEDAVVGLRVYAIFGYRPALCHDILSQ